MDFTLFESILLFPFIAFIIFSHDSLSSPVFRLVRVHSLPFNIHLIAANVYTIQASNGRLIIMVQGISVFRLSFLSTLGT
ncbi:hypothetical protein V8C26DRAFT_165098 [Trichoderma gracile]